MAPAKTNLQREQKLWELQRPPAGPIHTYKCLSKQSFNDGSFSEWVLSLTSKIVIPPKRDWVGAEAREVLGCFLKETLVQKKTNTQHSEYHHRLIYNTNY